MESFCRSSDLQIDLRWKVRKNNLDDLPQLHRTLAGFRRGVRLEDIDQVHEDRQECIGYGHLARMLAEKGATPKQVTDEFNLVRRELFVIMGLGGKNCWVA